MEIEIKAKIKDPASLREKVLALGAKRIADKHQLDIYLSPPDKSFCNQQKYYLRVRQDILNKTSRLEYHVFHKVKDGHGVSDEKETDIRDAKILLNIFKELKFLEVCAIDKKREAFQYKNFEIVLDRVKTLGNFIEVELEGKFSDQTKHRQRIIELLQKLGVRKEQFVKVGYVELMMSKFQYEKSKNERIKNLTRTGASAHPK